MATHSRNRDRGFPNAESFKAIRSLSWVGGISEEGVNGISASFKFKLNRSLMWLNGLVKTHSANSQGQKPRWPKEKKNILACITNISKNLIFAHLLAQLSSLWMGSVFSQSSHLEPTPVLLPGKSPGRRSSVGYSPWGRKESDMTEPLHFASLLVTHW